MCEAYAEINAILHKNALYFDDDFIEQITHAYKPLFDVIMNIRKSKHPEFPDEYKEVVAVAQNPR